MLKFEIIPLESINNVKFGTSRDEVRKHFGRRYEEFPKQYNEPPEEKAAFDKITKQMAEMAGKTVEEFLKGIPKVPEEIYDSYKFGSIHYDDNYIFNHIEIFKDSKAKIIVNSVDVSDFDLKKLKSLASDFIWVKEDACWISYSAQIIIACHEGKTKPDGLCFSCKDYFIAQ